MELNFARVTAGTMPQGNVIQIASALGVKWWGRDLFPFSGWVKGRMSDTGGNVEYAADTTFLDTSNRTISMTTAKAWRGAVSPFLRVAVNANYQADFLPSESHVYAWIDKYDSNYGWIEKIEGVVRKNIPFNVGAASYIRISFQAENAGTYTISNCSLKRISYIPILPDDTATYPIKTSAGVAVRDSENRFGYYNKSSGAFTEETDMTGTQIIRREYLESDGNQWINTNYVISDFNGFELDAKFLFTEHSMPVGMRTSTQLSGISMFIWEGNPVMCSCYGGTTTGMGTWRRSLGDRHSYKRLGANVYLDNALIYTHTQTAKNCTNPVYLFKGNTTISEINNSKMTCYGYKAYTTDFSVAQNMIPVSVSDIGYMLDTVEWKLYPNMGTGNFILGASKLWTWDL